MYLSRRSFVAGVVAASLLPISGVAQPNTQQLLGQVPGLESAYGRRYVPSDSLSWGEFPIEPNEETPQYLLIMALTFESEAMLTAVTNSMLNASIAGMILGRNENDLQLISHPELSDGNSLFFGEDDSLSHPYASLLVLPAGDVAYLISTEGESAAVQSTANAIATHLAETEPSGVPVEILDRGVAVGGPFDVFPGLDDLELLNGLVPLFDYDLLVSDQPIENGNATPEASPAS